MNQVDSADSKLAARPTRARVGHFLSKFLSHRRLPLMLAVGAVLLMLPALNTGFVLDDLPQRAVALRPDQLPPRMHETGNPADCGSFPTVIRDFFFHRNPAQMAAMKSFGVLPWWTPESLKLGLWRPIAAFTHWLDYQLYPNSPAAMHAHNIAWFAAILFLLTVIYRKLMGTTWPAGLAALLFLLDSNTYFPVAFIANRGFIMALFFGLMCLYQHHRWRTAKSYSGLWLSLLFLAMAVLTNEGGVSSFAFILAYALVLEPGCFRQRLLTILPAVLVIVLWRAVYSWFDFGVYHIGLYIDPSKEPLAFARELILRSLLLLAGQLPFTSPEVLFAVSPSLQSRVTVVFCGLALLALLVFVPWVRRDKKSAFWFASMIFAVIPAATVAPIGKNLGFVAVGAYGLIAGFVAALISPPSNFPAASFYRIQARIACVVLLLVHIPGALAGRALTVSATSFAFEGVDYLGDIGDWPNIENEHVIVINAPPVLGAYAPAYKAYHQRSLPRSLRSLTPGCTGFDLHRTDAHTLVIQSKEQDLFSCPDLGPIHLFYVFRNFNLQLGTPRCKLGDRYDCGPLKVEILQLALSGLPSKVACRFEQPLDSSAYRWLRFDWPAYRPFKIPAVGETVTVSGPARRPST